MLRVGLPSHLLIQVSIKSSRRHPEVHFTNFLEVALSNQVDSWDQLLQLLTFCLCFSFISTSYQIAWMILRLILFFSVTWLHYNSFMKSMWLFWLWKYFSVWDRVSSSLGWTQLLYRWGWLWTSDLSTYHVLWLPACDMMSILCDSGDQIHGKHSTSWAHP